MTVRDAINKSIDREIIEDADGVFIVNSVTQIIYHVHRLKEFGCNGYNNYDDIIKGLLEGINSNEDYCNILEWEYVDYAYSDEKVIFIYVNREDY